VTQYTDNLSDSELPLEMQTLNVNPERMMRKFEEMKRNSKQRPATPKRDEQPRQNTNHAIDELTDSELPFEMKTLTIDPPVDDQPVDALHPANASDKKETP
jgi:hypothetical protein